MQHPEKLGAAEAHLVHGDGVVLGQHLFQGIGHTGKLKFVRRLAVDVVAQYLSSSLALDHVQRPNGDPADAFHPLEIRLVYIL